MEGKRKNNGKMKLKEIRDFIRSGDYKIHEHFKKRSEEREFTDREVRRIVFDGKPTWTFDNRVKFDLKKNSVVIEFEDKDNGKVTGITLITIY